MTFLSPFDRAMAPPRRRRPMRVRRQQALAKLAHLVARRPDARIPLTALDARMDLLPHQLTPALASLAGHSRLVIADDVGLGKTIQAALVIAEVQRRERAARALVIAPATLRDQWAAELASRFALSPTLADRVNLDALSRAGAFGDNPWRRVGVWIASPDFLKQRHVLDSLPPDPWDVVVIDEAHVVCGDSDRFETCQQIARRARRLLLLTATPHSGDEVRFRRLFDLGRHDERHGSTDAPMVFRRTRESLGMPVARRVRWHFVTPSGIEARTLGALTVFERAVTDATRGDTSGHALLLLSVLRKRALSTFAALSRTVSRRLGWLGETSDEHALDWTQPRLTFDDITDDAAEEERTALTAHTGLDSGKERSWLRRLRQLADEAARRDTKVARLSSLVCRTTEPVVIFTEFRDSLTAIERTLHLSRSSATLHGAQDPVERRANLKRFLDGGASVLLTTDVASQGLNLQERARWVVSLELPWNPARLEQRVGRVDRLGQQRIPHMTLLVSRHPAESGLLAHVAKRVLTARREFSEDSLPALPSEAALRVALMQSSPLPDAGPALSPSSEPALVSNLRWRRLERAIAVELRQRRDLSQYWRAPADEAGGPIWTPAPAGRARPCGKYLVVCSISIRNERDEQIERLLLPALVDARCVADGHIPDRLAEAVGLASRRTIRRAVRKCARRARLAAARMIERECAVARFVNDDEFPGELQHRLFSRDETRAGDRQRAECDRVATLSARVMDRLREGTSVRAGAAVLEVIWIAKS